MARLTRSAALSLMLLSWPAVALAHPVAIDGSDADWMARSPAGMNLGMVARDSMSRGEFIWADPRLDARTDLPGSSSSDMLECAITGDATNLYVRVQTVGAILGPVTPQLQIAIDLDRAAGSGQTFLAGFADTTVASDAQWEFLIQTQATPAPAVRVLNSSFVAVATGAVSISGTTVEIAVPWSALGLMGAPQVARFTVATFQGGGDTVDIAGTSDALDVISDYGDPRPSAHPNTFAEVSDGDVDYFFDVWFEPSGEVRTPLAITRLVHGPTNAELVEVRNQTGVTLDLSGFFLGDEETPDGAEGMASFPAATLAPGATFVVATNGANYFTHYGVRADAEWAGTDASTADMVAFGNWASGNVAITAGEEILALGVGHTILDVATWGGGTYAGIVDIPGFGTSEVALRLPTAQDTDDGSTDFVVRSLCVAAGDCTATCTTCTSFSCAPAPVGTSCDDSDMCTMGEACTATGSCTGGSSVSCDDLNPCTSEICDPATGCSNPAVPSGTSCADADVCNGDESCDGSGTCVAGLALVCDDMNPCTSEVCDAATGCSSSAVAAGTSCADADMCNGEESCDGSGACVAGMALVCDDMNACTTDMCDAATGCSNVAVATGTACDDGDMCTTGDMCDGAGMCVATGTDPSCADGGMVDPDGGMVDPDGGAVDPDGGAVDPDGGMVISDAGTTDGGARDGGAGGADGGTDPMDGGCSCRAAGNHRSSSAPWLALTLLGLVWVRRRRR